MKILILDNYNSFTYNLVHYAEQFAEQVEVRRNDEISVDEVDEFDAIIISPGPGLPKDAGITLDVIKTYKGKKKILGVCLGHQAMVEAFGGKLVNMPNVLHGVARPTYILDKAERIFKNVPQRIMTGHYHSWAVDLPSLPDCFHITAADENAYVMAMRHKELDLTGVQFHPESILTEYGLRIVENWIKE